MTWNLSVRSGLRALLIITIAVVVGVFVFSHQWVISTVETSSMQPAVPKGSLVIVRHHSAHGLQPGQVAMYRAGRNQTVVHRVQAVPNTVNYRTTILFKGDANAAADNPIAAEAVVGRVVFIVPWLGLLVGFLRSWLGLVTCIYIPAILFICYEVNRLARSLAYEE